MAAVKKIPIGVLRKMRDKMKALDGKWAARLSAKTMEIDPSMDAKKIYSVLSGFTDQQQYSRTFVTCATELIAEMEKEQTEVLAKIENA